MLALFLLLTLRILHLRVEELLEGFGADATSCGMAAAAAAAFQQTYEPS